ncbi:MAG: hypothetical protein JST70_08730 [Bacteroidetes bacterium]|nr:hypothetical protein [Bacteroidota bacterium]
MKKFLLLFLLFAASVVAKAQSQPINITFTASNSLWPASPGGPTTADVTVAYTSIVGFPGYPVSVKLTHTFTYPGEVYTFTLNDPASNPMIQYYFKLNSYSLTYGYFSKATVDGATNNRLESVSNEGGPMRLIVDSRFAPDYTFGFGEYLGF